MATKKSATAADGKKGSVISVMRGINVSDAPMSSWLPGSQTQPIAVIRHGIRGTQNVMSSKDVSNPQTTETAKTSAEAIGLQLQFSLQTTPIRRLVVACDQPEERQRIDAFLRKAESSEELMELCRRYARRIMTGSFFWRSVCKRRVAPHRATVDRPALGAGCAYGCNRLQCEAHSGQVCTQHAQACGGQG
jgi:CRISPR-associated protein Csy3